MAGQGSAVTVLAVFCEADGEELLGALGRAGARLLPLTGPDGVEITPALSPPPAPKVNYNKQSLVIHTIDHLSHDMSFAISGSATIWWFGSDPTWKRGVVLRAGGGCGGREQQLEGRGGHQLHLDTAETPENTGSGGRAAATRNATTRNQTPLQIRGYSPSKLINQPALYPRPTWLDWRRGRWRGPSSPPTGGRRRSSSLGCGAHWSSPGSSVSPSQTIRTPSSIRPNQSDKRMWSKGKRET